MKLSSFKYIAFQALGIVVLLNSSLWAMASRPADPNAPPPPAWAQWAPMIMLVVVFYFFLLRPQSKQRKERENMLANLKKGDKIVTNSGFIVTVMNVSAKVLDVKLNDETRAKMMRSGVSEVLPEGAEADLTVVANGK